VLVESVEILVVVMVVVYVLVTLMVVVVVVVSVAMAVAVAVVQGESEKVGPLRFSGIFPKRFGIFRPNFACLLYVPIYHIIPNFIQLTPTLMKLCHIKRDHPVHIVSAKCPPSVKMRKGIFLHFPKQFLVQILHAYYTFLYMLEYKVLFNYLQL